MRIDEHLANEYLVSLGLGAVVYEPDGNRPPDFVINQKIAVEVRRLNQNEVIETGYRGLEETRFTLEDRVRKLLSSLGPSESGVSWFVRYDFGRPLPEWGKLRSALGAYLRAFRSNRNLQLQTKVSAVICEGFEITLMRASNSHSQFFVPGGCTDQDTGGWTLVETEKNLLICIQEKSRKAAPFRDKYAEWWLVLIDRIGYGVDICDRELFRKHLTFDHDWDKIILLNPLNPSQSAFELP